MATFASRPLPRPSTRTLAGALVLVPLFLAACGGGETGARSFEAPVWELGTAELHIGPPAGATASQLFVEAAVEGPGGRVHSLYAREPFVRSWSADGVAAGTPGAESAGGAVLPDPQALGVFGDSLWVADGQSYSVRFYGLDGALLGLLEPGVGAAAPGDPSPRDLPLRPREPLRDGTVLGVVPEVSEAVASGDQGSTEWVTMERSGAVRDTVWSKRWLPRDALALRGEGGALYVEPPFDDAPLAEVVAGDALVVVDRRVDDAGGRPSFRVTWIDLAGDTLAHTEVGYEPRPVTTAQVEAAVSGLAGAWRELLAEAGDDPGPDDLEDHVRDALFVPAHEPPVVDLVAGVDGSAWLRRPASESEEVEWWVLGPEGEPRARVEAPAVLRLLWVGPDHVLGSVVEPGGGSAIVRLPIVR